MRRRAFDLTRRIPDLASRSFRVYDCARMVLIDDRGKLGNQG